MGQVSFLFHCSYNCFVLPAPKASTEQQFSQHNNAQHILPAKGEVVLPVPYSLAPSVFQVSDHAIGPAWYRNNIQE